MKGKLRYAYAGRYLRSKELSTRAPIVTTISAVSQKRAQDSLVHIRWIVQSILQEVLQGKGAVREPLETWCISIRQCNDNLVLGAQRETGLGHTSFTGLGTLAMM